MSLVMVYLAELPFLILALAWIVITRITRPIDHDDN